MRSGTGEAVLLERAAPYSPSVKWEISHFTDGLIPLHVRPIHAGDSSELAMMRRQQGVGAELFG